LNARIDGSPTVVGTKADIDAALKELDPSFKQAEVEDEVSDIGLNSIADCPFLSLEFRMLTFC